MKNHYATIASTLLVACSGADTNTGAPGNAGTAPQAPVSAEPLGGTFGEASFVAKNAYAKRLFGARESDPARRVTITDEEYKEDDCQLTNGHDRAILFSVEWQSGNAYDLGSTGSDGLARTATFSYVDEQRGANNLATTDGRIEILDAPTEPGAMARIRLRLKADGGYAVEGEVEVRMCD